MPERSTVCPSTTVALCGHCDTPLTGRTAAAIYCDDKCRAAAWKQRTGYGRHDAPQDRANANQDRQETRRCRPTTSAPTSPPAAANGNASPNSPSNYSTNGLQLIATTRPSSSSASNKPAPTNPPQRTVATLTPISIPKRLQLASRADAEHEVDTAYRALQHRRTMREHRGGSGRAFRCQSCKRFIRNPNGRCPHCFYEPDLGWGTRR